MVVGGIKKTSVIHLKSKEAFCREKQDDTHKGWQIR